ncbi:MAG: HAMP domain-containing histidine kinase [Cellulosilyticum sp.]|nr:HAMP domain-containing histidine kinase [Cellulosilyticum sp.]
MKFWQKTFLILLVVFVLTFSMSMVIILHFTYKEELGSTRQKAMGEAYFIMSSLSSDFSNLENVGNVAVDYKRSAFKEYSDYYKQKKIYLGLFRDESTLANNLPDREIGGEKEGGAWSQLEVNEGIQRVWIESIQNEKYMIVASRLLAPYEDYKLCYAYEMSDLENTTHGLIRMVVGVDIMMTIILGGILFVVLTKLTKPLTNLQQCTTQIAAGDFGRTVEVKGQDEIATLGNQFNKMSLKIYEQMELLQEENRKKQLLIDNMAHEFRTPLTSISGYAQYLIMAALDEEARLESLDYIILETARLQKLSQTILYMADIREGELETSAIDVGGLIAYLKELFDKQKQYEKIHFTITSEVEYIKGNKVMVESLLINLIENGMRACKEEGQVTLNITADENQIAIQIKDTGIGMSKEELTKIQEPFYRIDKARSRKMGGVGLGVTLCHQIVSLHGAKIYYESDVGKGTSVLIHWPMLNEN